MLLRISIFLLLAACAADGQNRQLSQGLSDLQKAVEQLRPRKIYQAYFTLTSPSIPPSALVAPDTHGNAFLIILKETPIPNLPPDVSIEDAAKEIQDNFSKMDRLFGTSPSFDKKSRKIVYYTDPMWNRLLKATERYAVSPEEISDILKANQMVDGEYLALKIPESSEPFFTSLIEEGWDSPPSKFQYRVGWN